VERVLSVRFLGVILDCRLNREDHFKQVIKKGKSLINVLSLAAVWWDSHPQLLFTIYGAVFRGSIKYSYQIFVLENKKSLLLQLERLQYKAIRITLDYSQSTPINVILFEGTLT